ncbi:non-ribosomal peptide synthetase, partial [Bacillus thuringiensis]
MKPNTLTPELYINEDLEKEKQYWVEKLSGDIEFSSFLPDLETVKSEGTVKFSIPIPIEVSKKINKISNYSKWGAFLILITSINVILQKYTRNNDILIGTTGLKNGMDDLTLFRNTVSPDMTWKELLLNVKNTVNDAVDHQKLNISSLLSSMGLLHSETEDIYFPVLINFENLREKNYTSDTRAKIAFHFSQNDDNQITGEIIYQKVYSSDFIRNLATQFVMTIEQFIDNPEYKVGDLDLVTEREKEKLLEEFNQTTVNFGNKKLLHELVEEQVKKSADRVAIRFEESEITYSELNKRANQLAALLRQKGVSSNTFVGLMISPGIEMAIGLLSILKAGGAYVPIDPKYPLERQNAIIQDSGLGLLLKETEDRTKLDFNGEIIDLEVLQKNTKNQGNLPSINKGEDLAYSIYTSGTTGKPKGVMIQHKSITNNILWRKNEYKLTEKDRVLQLFSFSFDGFVTSFFTPLVSGAQIILVGNDDVKNPPYLYNIVQRHNITHFISTPSLYSSLLAEIQYEDQLCLRIITLAGEEVTANLLRESSEKLKDVEIANEYGPTENSVVTTVYRNLKVDSKISIGKPIANNYVYILDNEQKLQPIGMPGELCISGESLAKGYVNNQSLTNEKIVPNPFFSGSLMYRTGDLARWLPDGNLEYLGRLDEQVKIRGFRIELKDIEYQLKEYQSIDDVLVIALKDSEESNFLCAYYMSSEEIPVSTFRNFLEKRLPGFMIPDYFVKIDQFPLTINGKIDKKSLPEPKQAISGESTYHAPWNELEEKLITIWSQILGIEKEKIGMSDNLFNLGMHSLKIASFVSRIYREFEISIPIHIIFQLSTVKEQSAYISQIKSEKIYAIEKVEEREDYLLSSAQKRIYMLQALNKFQTSYNMPKAMIIEGTLDIKRVESTFQMLLKRHESLRTSFKVKDGNPVQQIHDYNPIEIELLHLRDKKISELIANFVEPFDLYNNSLIRLKLVELKENKHLLLIDMHHIIADGQSIQLLVNEFVQLYEGKELPELHIQYKDYAAWQNSFLKSEELQSQEHYWLSQFSEEYPVLQLPTDYPRPSVKGSKGDSISVYIGKTLTRHMHQIAARKDTTLFMLLLAAYNVLLSKYGDQEDIIVGTPISGRNHLDVENVIGMFVNTLALRNRPKKDKTFLEFLDEVKKSTLNAFENQDYPFELLVEKLKVQRDTSRNPIFDTMFTFQDSSYSKISIDGLQFSTVDIELNSSKFDLSLYITEVEEGLHAQFEYSTELFKKDSIERLSEHFLAILEKITESSNIKLAEIEMINREEEKLLLHDFNQTQYDNHNNTLLHELFEKQVERIPDKVALQFAGRTMTYKELNEQANQLARKIRKLKRQGEEEFLVSVAMERSFEMVKTILAILKAGGAYVPIDPHHPSKRIETIIKDSQTCVLLTQDKFKEKLSFYHEKVIVVDDQKDHKEEVSNLSRVSNLENLAYVIYTSGSTGKPKGVMIEHRNVLNTLFGLQRKFPITEEDAYLLKTPFIFDVSVAELFGWMLGGGRLVILEPEMEKDPVELYKVIQKERVTHVNFVPSMIQAFVDMVPDKQLQELTDLKYMFIAGEALSPKLAKSARMLLSHTDLYNLYGPTEASIYTTGYALDNNLEMSILPIGKPLDNTGVYILSNEGKLQPIGIPGELCIAGEGVARGYLNDEKRTKEKFISHPYKKDTVLYKTGDLVRWLPDGNIEYLGRKDFQIKVRGYRIEIGEIEYCIMRREGVREVVVIDREDPHGRKYLCAYIVSDVEWSNKVWHHYMREKLPEYMIPTNFVHLENMPLSLNGKLDRKALPKEEVILNQEEYIAPRNEMEAKLVQIWSEVLGIEDNRIGVTNDFFE